jgi:hypothetical protein
MSDSNITEISSELKGQFIRLYGMAMTDGEFSKEEWKMLYEFGESRGVSSSQLDSILLKTSGQMPVPENLEKKIEYLYDLAKMIWADGKVTEDERNTLKKYCKRFGLDSEDTLKVSDYLIEAAKVNKPKEDLISEIY